MDWARCLLSEHHSTRHGTKASSKSSTCQFGMPHCRRYLVWTHERIDAWQVGNRGNRHGRCCLPMPSANTTHRPTSFSHFVWWHSCQGKDSMVGGSNNRGLAKTVLVTVGNCCFAGWSQAFCDCLDGQPVNELVDLLERKVGLRFCQPLSRYFYFAQTLSNECFCNRAKLMVISILLWVVVLCLVAVLFVSYIFVQSTQSLNPPRRSSGTWTLILVILTWFVLSSHPSCLIEWILGTTSSIPTTTVPKLASASYGLCFCCEPGPWFSVLSSMLMYPVKGNKQ